MNNNFKGHFEAAKHVFNKSGGESGLEGKTIKETNENFSEAARKVLGEVAVSGVLIFDKEKGAQVLKSHSDLDGESAISILKLAGVEIQELDYVKPGDYKEGKVNLDTGDKFGVEYDEQSGTLFLDHHAKGQKEITSTAEIVLQTVEKLDLLRDAYKQDGNLKPALKKLVDFVTKIDNRKYPPEEFLKSAKTIIGLQRSIDFNKLLNYFKDHDSPTEELSVEEFEKYGLKDASMKQQQIIDNSMEKLQKMEKEGKFFYSKYGKVLLNVNNELSVGASAAYIKFGGIINITPGKSFAYTLRGGEFDENSLRMLTVKLGKRWQGKIIREQMWIYNDKEPLELTVEDLIEVTKSDGYWGKLRGKEINYYQSLEDVPEHCEACALIGGYCGNCSAESQFVKSSDQIVNENGDRIKGYFYDPKNIF